MNMSKNWLNAVGPVLLSALLALLAGCGDRGKGTPPEQKRMVIGTAAHIKAKRESTHRPDKPLPIGVSHQRFKDGKLLADDAPHPHILSSGSVLVTSRKNALVQVAYHEDDKGTLSGAVPSSFVVSDPSVVSEVGLHANTNAALVTLTGKKGNSFITALDARGDAISKFMVLSAEPQEDVLVVSDPDIHPMLCKGLSMGGAPLSCYTATATTFDRGHAGDQFLMDDYLKSGSPSRKFILFDDASLAKLKALNTNGSDSFDKRAIYFEKIDTLFVMNDGVSKINSMQVNGSNAEGVLPNLNALEINYVATQEEFNTYIDFGGKLSSSPLRDEGQFDQLVHEIPPGNSAKATLVGVLFKDGTELATSEDQIAYTKGSSRYPVDAYKYEIRQKGEPVGVERPECYVKAHGSGVIPKFSMNSFKTQAFSAFGSSFSWNGGKPDIELGVKPLVDVGGQISLELVGGGSVACSMELRQFLISEIGVPLFGSVKIVVPLEAKSEFFVEASGALVIVSPHFSLGSAEETGKPGFVGLKYSPGGGLKPEFSMKAALPKRHLGFAEGTQVSTVSGSPNAASAEFQAGYRVGIGPGLVMRAEVGSWIYKFYIEAELMDALIGVESTAGYVIDSARKKYRKFKSDAEGGIGIFAVFQPTITVNFKWAHLSFNLFDLGSRKLFFYEFPFEESEENDFEPKESSDFLKFTKCYSKAAPACTYQNQEAAAINEVNYVNSSEKFTMDVPLLPFFINRPGFFTYAYVVKDKASGDLVVNEIPMVFPDGVFQGKQGYANKYGITDVLAEAVYSRSNPAPGEDRYCAFSAWGDKVYTRLFHCPN